MKNVHKAIFAKGAIAVQLKKILQRKSPKANLNKRK